VSESSDPHSHDACDLCPEPSGPLRLWKPLGGGQEECAAGGNLVMRIVQGEFAGRQVWLAGVHAQDTNRLLVMGTFSPTAAHAKRLCEVLYDAVFDGELLVE